MRCELLPPLTISNALLGKKNSKKKSFFSLFYLLHPTRIIRSATTEQMLCTFLGRALPHVFAVFFLELL